MQACIERLRDALPVKVVDVDLEEGVDEHQGAHAAKEPTQNGRGPGVVRVQLTQESKDDVHPEHREVHAKARVVQPTPKQPPLLQVEFVQETIKELVEEQLSCALLGIEARDQLHHVRPPLASRVDVCEVHRVRGDGPPNPHNHALLPKNVLDHHVIAQLGSECQRREPLQVEGG